MAFPKPKDNKQRKESNVKRYIGVATCSIAGINVSDEEFKKITGHDRKKPLVVIEQTGNNPNYVRANIEIILNTVPSLCNNINATFIKRISISNTLLSSKSGKLCMIDQYGRTAWLTPDEAKNTNVPFIVAKSPKGDFIRRIEPASMRQAYGGEELVMNFIRALYGALDVSKLEEEGDKKVYKGNIIENAEVSRIDNIPLMLMGHFGEFNKAIESVKSNWVKIAVGVGNSDKGLVHVIYDWFMRPFENVNNVRYKITNDSKDDFQNATWDFEQLHEYNETIVPQVQQAATPISAVETQKTNEELPF